MKTSRPLSIKTFKDSCTKNKTRENTSHRLFPYGKDSRFHISIATIRADRKEWMKSVTYGRWSRTRRPAALRNGARYNPPSGARKIRPGAGKRPECSTHWATRGAPWRVMNRATDRQSPRERNRETDRERERERERDGRTERDNHELLVRVSIGFWEALRRHRLYIRPALARLWPWCTWTRGRGHLVRTRTW